MFIDELQKSLTEALNWAKVTNLPPVDTKEDVWIRALALTERRNGHKAYVAVVRDDDGSPRIIKDFCQSLVSVTKIMEVYPYEFLMKSDIPVFASKTDKESRLNWLKYQNPNFDYSDWTVSRLNKEIMKFAVKNALKKEKINNE